MRKKVMRNMNWIMLTTVLATLLPLTALAAPSPQAATQFLGNDAWPHDFSEMEIIIEHPEPNRDVVLTAIDKTQAALDKNPDNGDTRLELANLYYQAGNFQTAKETLQPLVEIEQPSSEAGLLMGELEYLLGNYDAAEAHLQKSVPIFFHYPGGGHGQAIC